MPQQFLSKQEQQKCSYIYHVNCMPNYPVFFFLWKDQVNSVYSQILDHKIYP